MDKKENLFIVYGSSNENSHNGNPDLPKKLAIPLLGIHPRTLYPSFEIFITHVNFFSIHNRYQLEIAYISRN